ncbi:MAG: chemotaxis protein CheR, partial [Novibacillus thermophilus]
MDDYGQFVAQVYRKTGINLADYKEAQMKRRLTSFRDREQYASFHDMLEAFNRDPTLLERFLNRITINVSEFFRNPERWQSLQKEVLPVLASN